MTRDGYVSVQDLLQHLRGGSWVREQVLRIVGTSVAWHGELRFQMHVDYDHGCEYVRAVGKRSARGNLPALESPVQALHRWRGRDDNTPDRSRSRRR